MRSVRPTKVGIANMASSMSAPSPLRASTKMKVPSIRSAAPIPCNPRGCDCGVAGTDDGLLGDNRRLCRCDSARQGSSLPLLPFERSLSPFDQVRILRVARGVAGEERTV